MKRYLMGTMACLVLTVTSFGATKFPPSSNSDVLAGELRVADGDLKRQQPDDRQLQHELLGHLFGLEELDHVALLDVVVVL